MQQLIPQGFAHAIILLSVCMAVCPWVEFEGLCVYVQPGNSILASMVDATFEFELSEFPHNCHANLIQGQFFDAALSNSGKMTVYSTFLLSTTTRSG